MFKRLIDWWTRPSWADYLAEQACRESAQDRQFDLIQEKGDLVNRLNATAALNSKLLLDLHEERQQNAHLSSCIEDFLISDTFHDKEDMDLRARALALLYPEQQVAASRDEGPIAGWQDRLAFDFNVSETSPVVKGTMVTVAHVVALIVDGWSWGDILRAHPDLTAADVRTCVSYAASQDSLQAEDARTKGETE